MRAPPEEVTKAILDLKISVENLHKQLENPAAYPHHLEEGVDSIMADANWLKLKIQDFIDVNTKG